MPHREGPFPQLAPFLGPQECPLALLSREEEPGARTPVPGQP